MIAPYLQRDGVTLYAGDCLDVLRADELGYDHRLGYAPPAIPDASVDAVVTDPPYGLEFMGKEWDSFAPRDRKNATVWDGRRQAQDGWQEDAAARSGKGGGGPSYRSQHKGAKRCEVCGRRAFSGSPCTCPEPVWVIEHRQEAPAAMLGFQAWCTEWARECYRVLKPGGHMLAFGGTRTWHRLACAVEDAGFEIRDSIAWMHGQGFAKSWNFNTQYTGEWCSCDGAFRDGAACPRCGGLNPAFRGFGTALKPAFEPVVVARKPLTGTVAQNVLTHGTGALNIDATRIRTSDVLSIGSGRINLAGGRGGVCGGEQNPAGRWPANVVLDERHESVLRLKYNLPTEVERTIRESFGANTSHLPAVRDVDHSAPEPSITPEVLRPPVPGALDVEEPDRREGAPVRQDAHGRISGEDVRDVASDRSTRPEESAMAGGHVQVPRLCDGEVGRAVSDRAGGVRPNGDGEHARRLPAGAPTGSGEDAGPCATAERARPSHQRGEGRQPAGESRGALERGSQADARRGGAGAIPSARREPRPAPSPLDVLRRECPPGWWQHFDVVGYRREGTADALDQQSGETTSKRSARGTGKGETGTYGAWGMADDDTRGHDDAGGASRFFYVAKASTAERPRYWAHDCECPHDRPMRAGGVCDECGTPGKLTAHATVKPLALMRWLVRLVTPPGGTVLEPFSGSGTTIEACLLEGYRCVAVEKEADYLPLIESRIARQRDPVRAVELAGADAGLFEFITDEEASA